MFLVLFYLAITVWVFVKEGIKMKLKLAILSMLVAGQATAAGNVAVSVDALGAYLNNSVKVKDNKYSVDGDATENSGFAGGGILRVGYRKSNFEFGLAGGLLYSASTPKILGKCEAVIADAQLKADYDQKLAALDALVGGKELADKIREAKTLEGLEREKRSEESRAWSGNHQSADDDGAKLNAAFNEVVAAKEKLIKEEAKANANEGKDAKKEEAAKKGDDAVTIKAESNMIWVVGPYGQMAVNETINVSAVLGVTGRNVTLKAFGSDKDKELVSKELPVSLGLMPMVKASYRVTNMLEIFGFVGYSFAFSGELEAAKADAKKDDEKKAETKEKKAETKEKKAEDKAVKATDKAAGDFVGSKVGNFLLVGAGISANIM